jgi:RNA polymerase sigma-70 factor (ECF subfamily)
VRAAKALEAGQSERMEREEWLRELMASAEPVLRGLARRMTGNDADAADLVQDCFERALRRADQLRDPQAARSWLISILRNAFLDRCRREALGKDHVEPPEDLPCPEEPAGEPAWAKLDLNDLRQAVEDLEPEFRTVYELREFQGKSYREIAGQTGTPPATVATRLHRARLKLRELLGRPKRGPSK